MQRAHPCTHAAADTCSCGHYALRAPKANAHAQPCLNNGKQHSAHAHNHTAPTPTLHTHAPPNPHTNTLIHAPPTHIHATPLPLRHMHGPEHTPRPHPVTHTGTSSRPRPPYLEVDVEAGVVRVSKVWQGHGVLHHCTCGALEGRQGIQGDHPGGDGGR